VSHEHGWCIEATTLPSRQAKAGEIVPEREATVFKTVAKHSKITTSTQSPPKTSRTAAVRNQFEPLNQDWIFLLQGFDRQIARVGHVRPTGIQAILANRGT